ncbi:MAG: hypothetical protein Q8K75_05155 [Chlamydiales bacterium]|nr:hypothetical protein [Chlamydiales bacterium]
MFQNISNASSLLVRPLSVWAKPMIRTPSHIQTVGQRSLATSKTLNNSLKTLMNTLAMHLTKQEANSTICCIKTKEKRDLIFVGNQSALVHRALLMGSITKDFAVLLPELEPGREKEYFPEESLIYGIANPELAPLDLYTTFATEKELNPEAIPQFFLDAIRHPTVAKAWSTSNLDHDTATAVQIEMILHGISQGNPIPEKVEGISDKDWKQVFKALSSKILMESNLPKSVIGSYGYLLNDLPNAKMHFDNTMRDFKASSLLEGALLGIKKVPEDKAAAVMTTPLLVETLKQSLTKPKPVL